MSNHTPKTAAAAAVLCLFLIFTPSCDEASSDETGGGGGGRKAPVSQTPAGKQEEPNAGGKVDKPEITDRDRKLAMAQFKSYCASCHGVTGKGDGPTGKIMSPKPRNWTDKAWQKKVTDDHLYELIRDGGQKHGLSPLMAKNPLYGDSRAGVLWALVEIVREFGK